MREIRIPRLGWSMEEGTFVGWLRQPGDEIVAGQPIFELEGEKASQEIESVDAGRLYLPPDSPQHGSTVLVGALIGYLLEPGEAPPVSAPAAVVSPAAATEQRPPIAPPSTVAPITDRESVATPRARRVAVELGVDWKSLAGSGRGGRVREADVRSAPQHSAPSVSMSPRRKAIAERLRASLDRTIPVTLTTTIDATNLVGLRDQFKTARAALIPAYTDIIACLAARVLARHPQFAVRWDVEHRQLDSIPADNLHIGIAVDTDDGLLVPVIRHVRSKSLIAVAEAAKLSTERARAGKLNSAEMQGGVLTITNLGSYGIDAFTPIINSPEIAILGLGAIRREAVVLADDRIVSQLRMTLSFTFDHAALDGAPAARLLRHLADAIESPAAELLGNE